jgi:transcriptional regulator with XRE-family HTH domain
LIYIYTETLIERGATMKENIAEIIGKRIKAKRVEIGMTQKGLADKVDISPSAINQFEKGEKKPSSEVLAHIANELGVSTDYLLGASDEEKMFLSDNVVAAFRDFKELSKKDREIVLSHIEFLKSKAKEKEKGK